ncbi:hypothetical protein [Spirosoma sp.]|uniref:hypothetical protein n=1 Tax=Spirosoma sp. TaxID=1899569 RepID=UPI00261E6443|nr:hypothetical protein [Spirosoma sp.]MCX6216514.1 hypothetical protein [Spirosoma sp.]
MITELKNIAREIANSRVRLSHPYQGKQTRQDILDEAKRLENVELTLHRLITQLEEKIEKWV